MNNDFIFSADDAARGYCVEILQEMVKIFNISEEEALERINDYWKGQTFAGKLDWIYHEMPEYWAKTIYYGPDVFWWLDGPKVPLKLKKSS